MIIETNLEKQQPTRVLIIDDSLESVRLMSHILDHYKCETTMAFDGQDAIPLLVHRHYDLIVLDWQMPQLGGRDTLLLMDRLLTEKKIHKIRQPIPVVIYTGYSEEELNLPLVRNFNYIGFINKKQALGSMMKSFNSILNVI
jgi:CheY-like chemotaxis protein